MATHQISPHQLVVFAQIYQVLVGALDPQDWGENRISSGKSSMLRQSDCLRVLPSMFESGLADGKKQINMAYFKEKEAAHW